MSGNPHFLTITFGYLSQVPARHGPVGHVGIYHFELERARLHDAQSMIDRTIIGFAILTIDMPFGFERLDIPEVILIKPTVFSDARGFFMESYKQTDFAPFMDGAFVQENHSRSLRGILRGLHFQLGSHAQGKLIRVVSGEIFDVAVDIRRESATRGKWVGAILSSDNRRMLYVPPWCAHGYCVLSEAAEVIYKTTAEYAPAHESGIMWNDPTLSIDWPIGSPTVSDRDKKWPAF